MPNSSRAAAAFDVVRAEVVGLEAAGDRRRHQVGHCRGDGDHRVGGVGAPDQRPDPDCPDPADRRGDRTARRRQRVGRDQFAQVDDVGE
jgi:hypothetical protein